MKEFRRKKLAFALACASVFGGKTQAMNKPQSRQTVATVVGATTKNSSKGFVNWVKNHKLGVGIGGVLTATTTAALIFLGVKYLGKKDSGGGPNIGGDPNKGNKPIEVKENEILKQNQKNDEQQKEKLKLLNGNEQNKVFENLGQNQSDEKIEDDKKEDAPVEIIDKNLAFLKKKYKGFEKIVEGFIQKLKDVRGKLTFEKLTSAKVFTKDYHDEKESWFEYKIVDNADTYNGCLPENIKIISKENVQNLIHDAVNETIEKLFLCEYTVTWDSPSLEKYNDGTTICFNLIYSVKISDDEKRLVLKYDKHFLTFDISKL